MLSVPVWGVEHSLSSLFTSHPRAKYGGGRGGEGDTGEGSTSGDYPEAEAEGTYGEVGTMTESSLGPTFPQPHSSAWQSSSHT